MAGSLKTVTLSVQLRNYLLFINLLKAYIAPSTAQGHLRVFYKFKSYTCCIQNVFNIIKKNNTQKHVFNVKIALLALPLYTIAIKLGHTGIVDLSV